MSAAAARSRCRSRPLCAGGFGVLLSARLAGRNRRSGGHRLGRAGGATQSRQPATGLCGHGSRLCAGGGFRCACPCRQGRQCSLAKSPDRRRRQYHAARYVLWRRGAAMPRLPGQLRSRYGPGLAAGCRLPQRQRQLGSDAASSPQTELRRVTVACNANRFGCCIAWRTFYSHIDADGRAGPAPNSAEFDGDA